MSKQAGQPPTTIIHRYAIVSKLWHCNHRAVTLALPAQLPIQRALRYIFFFKSTLHIHIWDGIYHVLSNYIVYDWSRDPRRPFPPLASRCQWHSAHHSFHSWTCVHPCKHPFLITVRNGNNQKFMSHSSQPLSKIGRLDICPENFHRNFAKKKKRSTHTVNIVFVQTKSLHYEGVFTSKQIYKFIWLHES